MLPASSSFNENQKIDSSSNKLVPLIFSFIYIALGLEMWIDLKDKKQSLVKGVYLSLELQDYKNFKYKDVMNMLRRTIPPLDIYRMSMQ